MSNKLQPTNRPKIDLKHWLFKNRFVDILFFTRMVFEQNGLNAGIFYKSELVRRNWKICRNEFPILKHLATFDDFGNSSEARPDSVFSVWTQFGKKTKTFFDLKCTVTKLFVVQRIKIIRITGLNRNNVEAKKRSWKWHRKMFSYWKISTMIDLWLERWNLLQISTCPWATQTLFKLEKHLEIKNLSKITDN